MTQMFYFSLHGYKLQVQIAIFVAGSFLLAAIVAIVAASACRKCFLCAPGAKIPTARRRVPSVQRIDFVSGDSTAML
jgi:hypothetical protein